MPLGAFKQERCLEASSAALELIARLPLDEVGCLYLDRTGKPVCPDPAATEFPKLARHFGTRPHEILCRYTAIGPRHYATAGAAST